MHSSKVEVRAIFDFCSCRLVVFDRTTCNKPCHKVKVRSIYVECIRFYFSHLSLALVAVWPENLQQKFCQSRCVARAPIFLQSAEGLWCPENHLLTFSYISVCAIFAFRFQSAPDLFATRRSIASQRFSNVEVRPFIFSCCVTVSAEENADNFVLKGTANSPNVTTHSTPYASIRSIYG